MLHFLTMGILVYAGTLPAVATTIGAIIGAVFNYIFQYYYTFRSVRRHLHSMLSYLVASSLAWTSNLFLFLLFHDSIGLQIIIAQLVTTAIVTIQNYFVYKKVVFHPIVSA